MFSREEVKSGLPKWLLSACRGKKKIFCMEKPMVQGRPALGELAFAATKQPKWGLEMARDFIGNLGTCT